MRHRSPGAAKVAVLLAVSGSIGASSLGDVSSRPAGSDPGSLTALDQLERRLVGLLQGDVVPVAASPALCAAVGQGESGVAPGTTHWYFGTAPCDVQYPPSTSAIVTSATRGLSKRLSESPSLTQDLDRILDDLAAAVATENAPVETKLRLHSTAWEVGVGLSSSLAQHPERAEPLLPTLCKSFELLRRTRFTAAEVADLAPTLGEVSKLVEQPRLARVMAAILRRDPEVVEVYPSTNSHAEALLGRFSPRIFLSSPDQPERLLAAVDGGVDRADLRDLPQKLNGLIGVLVLYFNVLTDANTITATEHVAALQAYRFSGKTSAATPFQEAAKLLDFTTVLYERDYGHRGAPGELNPPGSEFHYRLLQPQSLALEGFVDAKPAIGGIPATTLRGNCLGCHIYRVETFNTHVDRSVTFTAPFTHPSADLIAGHTQRVVLPTIQRQLKRCAEGGDRRGAEAGSESPGQGRPGAPAEAPTPSAVRAGGEDHGQR